MEQKRRGRPPGSKNKSSKAKKPGNKAEATKKKRGRPPGSKAKQAGRPRKIGNALELEEKLHAYLRECSISFYGTPIDEEYTSPTITSFCLYAGISLDTFARYGEKKEFSGVIKKARMIIQAFNEWYIYNNKNITGAIFMLKCKFGFIEEDKRREQPDNNEQAVVFLPSNEREIK